MNNAGTNLVGKRKKKNRTKLPKILPEQQQEAPNKNLALAISLLRDFCSFPFPRVMRGSGNAGRASFQAPAVISVHFYGETASLSPGNGSTLHPAGQAGALGLHHTHRNSLGRSSQGKEAEAAGGFFRAAFCLQM